VLLVALSRLAVICMAHSSLATKRSVVFFRRLTIRREEFVMRFLEKAFLLLVLVCLPFALTCDGVNIPEDGQAHQCMGSASVRKHLEGLHQPFRQLS